MVGANHAAYTDWFHELAKLVSHLVTPESARIKRYVAGLSYEIRGMIKATQPTTIQDAILRADILTDEAISCGTLSKSNEKRKAVEETGNTGGSWRDGVCRLCFNCQRPGHFAKDCRAPFKRATPINSVRMEFEPGTCYECGSHGGMEQQKLRSGCEWDGACVGIRGGMEGQGNGGKGKEERIDIVVSENEGELKGNGIRVKRVVADGKKVEVDRIILDWKLEQEIYLV
ncbi:reverse transcriptase domain-containing protein [Tanacetum coccineum]